MGYASCPRRRWSHGRQRGWRAVLNESYLLLVLVLPAALFAVGRYRSLTIGRQCRRCGAETVPLVDRRLRIVSRLHPLSVFQRRWCLICRWEGAIRMPRRQTRGAPGTRKRTRSTETLDLRSLTVDGLRWRVLLHCWHDTGLFYGRYVFIAPSGRLWLDGLEPFSSSTQQQVVDEALSLPDGLLLERVRRLAGDC